MYKKGKGGLSSKIPADLESLTPKTYLQLKRTVSVKI